MPDQTPWYEAIVTPGLLRHARNTYGTTMRRALEEAGYGDIPGNGLYVLGALALGNGDVPLGDLIRQLRISKQAAGQLIDTLAQRAYLRRTLDPNDRRRLNVTLTDRGRSAATVQAEARDRIDTELLARTGPDDVIIMRRTLAALIEIGRQAQATFPENAD